MTIDLTSMTDGELVALALARHDAAFAEIVRRHRAALYRMARASLGDADDALDAVQDSFVSAHRSLGRFDRDRPLRPWLARIALNACRDRIRRRIVRRYLLPFAADAHDRIADDAPHQDVATSDRQELERTMRAIAALPTATREPLVLCAIDGMSQADAASVLGLSVKAVETRVRRAREALRIALDRA